MDKWLSGYEGMKYDNPTQINVGPEGVYWHFHDSRVTTTCCLCKTINSDISGIDL